MRRVSIFFTGLFALSALFVQGAQAQSPLFRAGLGAGVGFGGVGGLSAEAEWRRLAVVMGVASWAEDLAYEAGLRYHFRAPGVRVRPHGTVSYGATHMLEYSIGGEEYQGLFYGVNVLAGLDHDFRKPGGFMMTYGLGLALPLRLTAEDEDRIEGIGQNPPEADPAVTFAIGIKYEF